ncbi:helix-turn-helix domain-containing protein [Anaerosinus massiliensis]|uniref:helix-turn-helix domain-containing protein n=1 Tax=Massilibacillus massiliensis TaxID=1806837 RepID=UPI000DA61CA2|nr:helix-turn-helix transcriptional regulator [Massilibacillus massiliensis]
MEEIKTKKCTGCGKELPISEFHKCKATKDGLQYHCKHCVRITTREYRHSHPEKTRQFNETAYLRRNHMIVEDLALLPRKEKECTQCKRVLPLGEFYKNRSTRDGLLTKCKKCINDNDRAYRQANLKSVREHERESRKNRKKHTFSNFLKEKRSEMGFTQKEMANYLGMTSRSNYSRYEQEDCKSMNNDTIKLFSRKLHVRFIKIVNMLEFRHKSLINKRFGRLKVVDFYKTENGASFYLCKCECGNEKIIRGNHLINGSVISCGCANKENRENLKNLAKKNYKDGTSVAMIKSNKIPTSNTSGVKGVSWSKQYKKWRAYIIFKGKQIELGRYENIDDAATARKDAEEKYFKAILEDKNE